MHMRNISVLFTLALASAACGSGADEPRLRDSEPAPAQTVNTQRESLSLSAERTRYLPFQRIVLLADYTGPSAPLLSPEAGEVELRVRGPGGEERVLAPVARYCAALEDGPRATSALLDVTSDQAGWVFEQPGTYQVTLHRRSGGLSSTPLVLTIEPPSSEEDLAAHAALRGAPAFAEFQHFDGGDRFPGELALATSLAEGHSSYRADMRDLLVRHHARQSVTLDGTARAPNLSRALFYYDPADRDAEITFSKAAALRYLARLEREAPAGLGMDIDDELRALERSRPSLRFARLQHKVR